MSRGRCSCISCQVYGYGVGALDYSTDRYKSFKPHPCELCKILHPNRFHTVGKPSAVPGIVRDFFGIYWCCEFCMNTINANVQNDFRLCWGKSPDEAIELALLKMLRSVLMSESNKDTYRKQIVTRCIRAGYELPQWATRADRARQRGTIKRRDMENNEMVIKARAAQKNYWTQPEYRKNLDVEAHRMADFAAAQLVPYQKALRELVSLMDEELELHEQLNDCYDERKCHWCELTGIALTVAKELLATEKTDRASL